MIREVFQMILYTYLCFFILIYSVVAWRQVSNLHILSQIKKTLSLSASDDVKNDLQGYLFTNLQSEANLITFPSCSSEIESV